MKIYLFNLITGLIMLSVAGQSQTYESKIIAMFSSQDDIDFVVVSENNGSSFNGQYFIANDTLYEGYSRKIAIRDIDFSAIDIYKNVFNKINGAYPYVLTLKPIANRFTYYYGTAVNTKLELYLPNQQYAIETFAYLKIKSKGGYAETNAKPSTEKPGPEEVCKSTVTFLNDLYTTNFSTYLGNLITGDKDFRYYQSTISFPLAIETSIADTNMFSTYYRGAEILMMEESVSTQTVSSDMLEFYNQLKGVLKLCLESNGFEYKNRDDDPMSFYKLSSDFTKFAPIDQNALFANLQERRGLLVHLRVLQNKLDDGRYSNKLYIYFKAQ